MLRHLKLLNFKPSETLERQLRHKVAGQVFILRTCQRTLAVGFNQKLDPFMTPETDVFHGLEAYEFLLQTICGLKSRILGENEIVHQFKDAYGEFLSHENPNRLIQNVLEKLFKDAKEIRTKHLRHIGLDTYAGISRKILMQRMDEKKDQPVLVLGSGNLAEDFIKITHRRMKIVLCARNADRVSELSERFHLESLPWEKREERSGLQTLLNTIGTEDKIFMRKSPFETLVDLGEPSPFRHLEGHEGYFSLNQIFEIGKSHREIKNQKLTVAFEAIKEKTNYRQGHFSLRIPNGWDELLFA